MDVLASKQRLRDLPSMLRSRFRSRKCVLAVLLCLAVICQAREAEPHWVRVSSAHFSVLTDSDEKNGRDVVVRFEQMRVVFAQLLLKNKLVSGEPLEIIALRSDDEYIRHAPVVRGQPAAQPGFFLPGEDRAYIVLSLDRDDNWRAISRDYARFLLNYNYPPTQGWFDEGLAQYFSSVYLDDQNARIGGDPDAHPGALGAEVQPLADLLNTSAWLRISDLLSQHHESTCNVATPPTLFCAQSWIVVHYLINQKKLPETGTYFDLVENQGMDTESAIGKAYGMSAAQFEQAVKDHFRSLAPWWQGQSADKRSPRNGANGAGYSFPAPIPAGDIGTSTQPVLTADAGALLAEMELRLPEHREQALKDLESMANQPVTENAIAHRAIGWAHLQKREFDAAAEDLAKDIELDAHDVWGRYCLALLKYQASQLSGRPMQGLANMIVDLRMVLDWDPEFAEAYNMLAMARLAGGGTNSAIEAMRAALELSPRNEVYVLNMAQVYMAGRSWEAATALLERLSQSSNSSIAQAAHKHLEELPTLKKYGVLPQSAPEPQSSESSVQAQAADADTERAESPSEAPVDHRPVRFLKARLLAVDCSQSPAAILSISVSGKKLRLRTADYHALTLVGADEFSCNWVDRPISVNYKAGGKADGDLVSLEVQ